MKKLLCSLLIVVSTISFISCDTSKPADDNDNVTTTEDSNNNSDENTDTGKNTNNDNSDADAITGTNSDTNNNEDVNNGTATDNSSSTTSSNDSSMEVVDNVERTFKISTKDIVSVPEKIVYANDIVTVGLGVGDNLRLILETVSTDYFDGNIVELKTIETIEDTKIAVVNLTGDEIFWHNKFSGSAGASVTEYTLIENVLQRDYPGYWVDGVRFTLNDKPIIDNGHIPNLEITSYR